MKLWSRGLGKTEVYMDFRQYQSLKDPVNGNIIIVGNMQEPVTWEFKITLQPEDIAGVMKLLFNFDTLKFIMKNLYQYLIYLVNRQQYKSQESSLENVNRAYEQVTGGGRNRRKHSF